MHKLLTAVFLFASICAFGSYDTKVFVFLNSKLDKAKISEDSATVLQKLHRANISKMVKEKKMIVAGPFEGGGGIFILNTDNVLEAKEWLI